ncbi:MAG: hypothetical protein GYB67_03825 [Chloroflexi bacterium]|nr:hypothetical protein [Chloroflexota bacterium]
MSSRPLTFRDRSLITAVIAFIIVFVIWNIPFFSFLLYPFRLFVTFIHESGHGLASIATGGEFLRFEVFDSGAGLALTRGGNPAFVLPAGYLGAAAFGAGLFYLAHTIRHTRGISIALGAILALITILYTGLLSPNFSATAFFVGLLMSGLLIFIGRRADQDVNLLVLNILAMLTSLHAVLDLIYLVSNSGVGLGQLRNDAFVFSREVAPILPPAGWAARWALLAVIMLGASVYYSLIRPRRQRPLRI